MVNYVINGLSHIDSCGIEFIIIDCPSYLHERKVLLDNIKFVLLNILEENDCFVGSIFLLGDTSPVTLQMQLS